MCKKDLAECSMDGNEMQGNGGVNRVGSKMTAGVRTGYIYHRPNVCKNSDGVDCVYVFAVRNPSSEYRAISLRINTESYNPGDVDLTLTYQNIVQYGKFINYEVNPKSNKDIQPYL